ncbi:MAG: hypothetical protein GY697_24225 [Desulfobacterales bacterium]|nr:hypothetical protein [Desulfobacterales bacterium]
MNKVELVGALKDEAGNANTSLIYFALRIGSCQGRSSYNGNYKDTNES